jgi:hypothetical protein
MKNKKLFSAFCILFSLSATLDAKSHLIESADISHVFHHLEEDTLFVFDLDNTLIETAQHLGSDQWFTYQYDQYAKDGFTHDQIIEVLFPRWVEILHWTQMSLVDPAIPNLLAEMQGKDVAVIGLTKRLPELAPRTFAHIEPFEIDFSLTAPVKDTIVFDGLNGTLSQQGIIFVGEGINKGDAMIAYLNQMEKKPKKVVIVDDKMSHVKSVAKAMDSCDIDCIGIRFGGADAKVNAFNPKIADLQWKHFPKGLSDEQALEMLDN